MILQNEVESAQKTFLFRGHAFYSEFLTRLIFIRESLFRIFILDPGNSEWVAYPLNSTVVRWTLLSKQSLVADHLIFVSHEQFEVLKTEMICLFSTFDDLKWVISNESSAEQLFLTFKLPDSYWMSFCWQLQLFFQLVHFLELLKNELSNWKYSRVWLTDHESDNSKSWEPEPLTS